MKTVLVVEDETAISEVIAAYLVKEGFTVIVAATGIDALQTFESQKVDLVILDLNLPGIDGIEVCRSIRKTSKIPVIMVTARVEELDEIVGLQVGADDYVTKPFSPKVLVARVHALMRRFYEPVIVTGLLEINAEKMEVKKSGQQISLTTTQFALLYALAKEPGRVFTREELLEKMSDTNFPKDVYDRTVDAHIKSIRRQIEDNSKKPQYIQTVIGKGYRFNGTT